MAYGGPSQPCVSPGHRVKRAIYYFRNVLPNYGNTVDLHLDADCNNDGCPDGPLGVLANFDPGLRWHCAEFGACIPCGGVIGRQVHRGPYEPSFATDGPTYPPGSPNTCDPSHSPTHSFLYSANGLSCAPWNVNLDTAPDDFLQWLVVDDDPTCATATENASWGSIKGLYR